MNPENRMMRAVCDNCKDPDACGIIHDKHTMFMCVNRYLDTDFEDDPMEFIFLMDKFLSEWCDKCPARDVCCEVKDHGDILACIFGFLKVEEERNRFVEKMYG